MCSKSSHTHNIGDSNYVNSVEGIDKIIAGIRAHKPDIVLEMCADGKRGRRERKRGEKEKRGKGEGGIGERRAKEEEIDLCRGTERNQET